MDTHNSTTPTASVGREISETAREFHEHGIVPLPIAPGINKAPAVSWRAYQTTPPTLERLGQWFPADGNHPHGLGLLTGAVSGNLEMTEIEGEASDRLADLEETMTAHHPHVWEKLAGWCELSPSGGIHWFYQLTGVPGVEGNKKLARRPSTDAEVQAWKAEQFAKLPEIPDEHARAERIAATTGARLPRVLAETRGEGGFVVTAPTPGTFHTTNNPWQRLEGGPDTCPTLTAAERDAFHAVLTTLLDTMPTEAPEQPVSTTVPAPRPNPTIAGDLFGRTSPLDDFEARNSWADILTPHGWKKTPRVDADGTEYWLRPGSAPGAGVNDHSASTGHAGDRDRLYVFSTNTVFDTEVPYTKVGALAVLEYDGDHAAMARDLARRGYGSQLTPPTPAPAPPAPTAAQPTTNPTEATETAPLTLEQIRAAETEYINKRAAEQRLNMLATEQARRLIAAEQTNVTELPAMTNLAQRLAGPRPEIRWRIEDMWPHGGRVNLVAAPKTGKTTMVLNIARALTEGGEFLGTYDTEPLPDNDEQPTMVIFDFEMTEGQILDWYESHALEHPERIEIVPLRGFASQFDFLTPETRDKLVQKYSGAHTYVLDPIGPVLSALGLEENSNSEVQRLLTGWDEFVRLLGGRESMVVVHAGHNGERARGASAFLGSGDAIWTMVRDADDESDTRFLKAIGRGVELVDTELVYEPARHRLTLGSASRSQARAHRKAATEAPYVLEALGRYGPHAPRALWEKISGSGEAKEWEVTQKGMRSAFKVLEEQGAVVVVKRTAGGGAVYDLADTSMLTRTHPLA